jgi:Holliday junction resolvasome RuvABC endonuclease subunit
MPDHALDLFAAPAEPAGKWVAPLLGESVLGIDPSMLGFAICYTIPGRPLQEGEWKSEPADGVLARMARCEQLIRGTLQIVSAHKPGLVLIEAYAYNAAHSGQAFDRAELGGILRWELVKRAQCPIVEVAPNSLKKFATGNGGAKKPEMISALTTLQQRRIKTDNQADAAALCELGNALLGYKPPPLWVEGSNGKKERAYLAALRKGYKLPEVQS